MKKRDPKDEIIEKLNDLPIIDQLKLINDILYKIVNILFTEGFIEDSNNFYKIQQKLQKLIKKNK